jgi:serine protease Do
VIIEFNGHPVRDSRHLKLEVAQTAPNAEVPVKVSRDGKQKEITVTLKEFPSDKQLAKGKADQGGSGDPTDGITVDDLSPEARRQFNIPSNVKGALVTDVDPDSPGYDAGLRPGDVILEINRKPVRNAQDAISQTEDLKKEDSVLLRVYSRGGSRYLVLKNDSEKNG